MLTEQKIPAEFDANFSINSIKEYINSDEHLHDLLNETILVDEQIISTVTNILELSHDYTAKNDRESNKSLQKIGLEVLYLMRKCPTLYFKDPIISSEEIVKRIYNIDYLGDARSIYRIISERIANNINIERHRVTSLIEEDIYGLRDIFSDLEIYLKSQHQQSKLDNMIVDEALDKLSNLIAYFDDYEEVKPEYSHINDYFAKITFAIKTIKDISNIFNKNTIDDNGLTSKLAKFYKALFNRISSIFSEDKVKNKAIIELDEAWSNLGANSKKKVRQSAFYESVREFEEKIIESKIQIAKDTINKFKPKSPKRF